MDSSRLASGLFQISDAYVYSAFQWGRYPPALNVCAPRFLYGSMDSKASTRNRFIQGGYRLSDPGLSLNSLLPDQAAAGYRWYSVPCVNIAHAVRTFLFASATAALP
jgi:hypothetical protein